MSISSKLTMRCKITSVTGQDTSGEPLYGGSASDVPCFAFGNTRRVRDRSGREYVPTFQILFLPDVSLGNDYKIEDVTDIKGSIVLKSGVVIDVTENFHPKKGLVLKQVYVNKL